MLTTQAIVTAHSIQQDLASTNFSYIFADELQLSEVMQTAWEDLRKCYPDLPPDNYLPNDRKYRFRRYGRFQFETKTGNLTQLPHVDYFQSEEINRVTGGIIRKFAPLTQDIAENPFLQELIRFDFRHFPLNEHQRQQNWVVDVHLIRVVASADEAGHPTPEGIHKDGAEFVTIHLAEHENAEGGTASIYDNDKELIHQLTLTQILDTYIFNDLQTWHKADPIRPIDPAYPAVRSILTFDYHLEGQ